MDNEVKPSLDHVYGLFTERQKAFDELTTQIVTSIQSTVLDAVVEVLEVDSDGVQWVDINFYDMSFESYSDAVLMISCVVEYPSEEEIPALLYEISPEPDPQFESTTKRFVRLGIPFDFIAESKEDIKMMLYRTLLGELQQTGNISEDELWDAIVSNAEEQAGSVSASEDSNNDNKGFDHIKWFESQQKGKLH